MLFVSLHLKSFHILKPTCRRYDILCVKSVILTLVLFFLFYCVNEKYGFVKLKSQFKKKKTFYLYHHHVLEGLGMLACSLILQMKLVPPSLPRSSYVSSSVWFVF